MRNDKVDHPRNGSKDLADATCGAVFNAIAYTDKPVNMVIEVRTLESITKEIAKTATNIQKSIVDDNIIRVPKREIPDSLVDFLEGMRMI
jgi:hypothetical protein